jgi:hypothetical protein
MMHEIHGAEVFMVGTHNGLEFTQGDLDNMVSAFNDLNLASRVPLKLGHNDEQPVTDGQPALGWVSKIWTEGGKLFADFVNMPTVVFNAIKQGLYKHVSVELLQNMSRSGSEYPWVLDAVALLGADIPAVRELNDLQTLAMTSKLPGVRFSRVATFTSASTIKTGVSSTMTDEEIKAMQKELADEKAARAKDRADFHRKHISGVLESAVKAGTIDPAIRDRVEKSRQFKSDVDVVEFWTEQEINNEIERNKKTFTRKEGVTSHTSGDADKMDTTVKTNAQAMTFKAQAECVRVGGRIDNFDDMDKATKRVLNTDKALAKAYLADPNGDFVAQSA